MTAAAQCPLPGKPIVTLCCDNGFCNCTAIDVILPHDAGTARQKAVSKALVAAYPGRRVRVAVREETPYVASTDPTIADEALDGIIRNAYRLGRGAR